MGRFVGAFAGVLEGLKPRKLTLVGAVVGALVGDFVGALVGPLVDPLVVPLVDPPVGRGSLSPALCVAHFCFLSKLQCTGHLYVTMIGVEVNRSNRSMHEPQPN